MKNTNNGGNPANDVVTIQVGSGEYTTVTFTNVLGQEVENATLNNTQTQVNVSGLPACMYYITLRGDKVVKFEKRP